MPVLRENIEILKTYLEENLREKENDPEIPKTGMAVLQQQIVLADAIEKWIISLKRLLMKKSLADFLLGLQDWEETGMDADLCSGFVART